MHNLCPRRSTRLGPLALALESAAEIDGRDQPPFAVGVAPAGRDVELHLHDLASGDPALELVGFHAPPEWCAFGVVTAGIARPVDDSSGDIRALPGSTGERVRLVHLVDRSGAETSLLRMGDARPRFSTSHGTSGVGRLVDSCRRVLGLSTSPPGRDPCELWALLWLDRMVTRVLDDPELNLTWRAAARLHPAAELAARDPHLAGMVPERLVELGAALAAVTAWERLRERCADGDWPIEGITPDDAAWMDDGMFSRWALAAFPLVHDLLEPLDALLPPPTTCQVLDALDAWGLT